MRIDFKAIAQKPSISSFDHTPTIYVEADDCWRFLSEAQSQGVLWVDYKEPLSWNPVDEFDAIGVVFYIYTECTGKILLSYGGLCRECPKYVDWNYSEMQEQITELPCEQLNLNTLYPELS